MSIDESTRRRTFTWDDPVALFERGRAMSGLDFMRAVQRGELPPPPIARLMEFEAIEVEDGRVVFAGRPGEYVYNPIGAVHGGFAATLLDSAMGCAVHATLAAGVPYTTLELKVNYVRPITAAAGRVRAEGRVLHRGRQVATAEGRLTSEATGKLLAHASTTCLIMEAPGS